MVNDINGFRSRSLETPDNKSTSRAPGSGGPRGTSPAPSSGPSDTVNLTDAAGRMRELEAQLAQAPEVDSARVDALRRSIADGRYQIDDVHVTDKLIQLEQGLFGMSRKK